MRGTPGHKSLVFFTTCSHWHKGLISQPFPVPGSRLVRRLGWLPRTKAGFSGTEAWAAPGLWGRYKLRIYGADQAPSPSAGA